MVRPLSSMRRSRLGRHGTFYLTILPFLVLFGAFGLFPVLASLYLGFTDWDGLSAPRFVGIQNYVDLVRDPVFRTSIANTLMLWACSTAATVGIAFVLAFLVNYYVPGGRSVLQVVFLAPLLVAPAMTAIITQAMFSSNGGVVNDLLGAALRHPVTFDWTRSAWALKALIVWMVVWRWTGWHMVIFVAGFQTIPLQTYEAAIVDGARPRQIFRLVTLPLMRPIVMFSLITATVGGLQLFDEVYVLTGGTGGAQHAGMTMAIYLYQAAFQDFRFGLGSAAAYVIFALIMAASLLLSRSTNPQGAAA